MRVILEGTLRHFPAGELLALFAERRHSGTLDAKQGEARVRLAFREGRVVGAEATGADSLEAIVAMLVGWREGDFWFLDDVAIPEGAKPMAADVMPLVEAAEARAAEEQRLLGLYPDDQLVFRVNNKPQGDVSLRPEEFPVLFAIGGGKSLAQLRAELGRPAVELYAVVARLQRYASDATTGPPPHRPPRTLSNCFDETPIRTRRPQNRSERRDWRIDRRRSANQFRHHTARRRRRGCLPHRPHPPPEGRRQRPRTPRGRRPQTAPSDATPRREPRIDVHRPRTRPPFSAVGIQMIARDVLRPGGTRAYRRR